VRILVTGGAGYIGSVTTRLLLDRGHDCVVLDTLERGHREAVDARAELVVGDVGDRKVLADTLPGCDAVLHFAGYIDVAESERDPQRYLDGNVTRPTVMLDWMERVGVRSLVFSSTAAVYGEPVRVPITEDATMLPVNKYGASKLAFEHEIRDRERRGALRAIRLRYFNVAGAWPDGSLGEAHDPETHIIPLVLTAMAAGERDFEVFGGDYATEDGTCVRDYVHVLDLANAHALALARLETGAVGSAINLGNGRGYSNLEVVRACAEATGCVIEPRMGPRRAGDPAVLVASHERAERELGWRPERPGLSEMVADAWRWHSSHPSGYAEV
jgi:UDP-glucose 4-epimerase